MTGHQWTVAELSLLRSMADEGHSSQTIAKALGRSRSAVCGMAHRRGLRLPGPANAERKAAKAARLAAKPARRGGWTQTRTEQLAALVAEGLTAREIGERMGASKQAVIDACKRYGIEMRRGRKRVHEQAAEGEGPKIRRPRWTPQRVAELSALVAAGMKAAEIGERMGLAKPSVLKACRRHGLTLQRWYKPIWTDDRLAVLRECAAAQASAEEAAERLGVPVDSVKRAARKFRLTLHRRPLPAEGGEHGGYRPQRVWTDDKLAVMREVAAAGGTAAQAAERLGVPASALKSAARKFRIKFDPAGVKAASIWDGKDDRLRELVAAGLTRPRIAEQLGVSVSSVRSRCLALGIGDVRNGRVHKAGVGPSPAAQVSLAGVSSSRISYLADGRITQARLLEPAPVPVGNVVPLPVTRPTGASGRLPFLDAVNGRCRMPLWADKGHVPLEDKFVCGVPTKSLKESYCPACRATAWTKPRAPVRRAVKAAIERRVGSW